MLILYFENSKKGYKEETLRIRKLFIINFYYKVKYYAILSNYSHLRLNIKINSFLDNHGDLDYLIIIYYKGYSDPNNNNA